MSFHLEHQRLRPALSNPPVPLPSLSPPPLHLCSTKNGLELLIFPWSAVSLPGDKVGPSQSLEAINSKELEQGKRTT